MVGTALGMRLIRTIVRLSTGLHRPDCNPNRPLRMGCV